MSQRSRSRRLNGSGKAEVMKALSMVKSPGDRGALDQSNWHSRPSDDWWETRGDAAPAWELASWKMLEFTDAERDAWIAHGL